jgi:ribonuclease P protein component
MRFATIIKRRDFLKVRDDGKYMARRSFVIQYLINPEKKPTDIRFGFTATKRVGNAVVRNRCKRRLRALIHTNIEEIKKHNQSIDFVLIARHTTPDIDYSVIKKEFLECLNKIRAENQV